MGNLEFLDEEAEQGQSADDPDDPNDVSFQHGRVWTCLFCRAAADDTQFICPCPSCNANTVEPEGLEEFLPSHALYTMVSDFVSEVYLED